MFQIKIQRFSKHLSSTFEIPLSLQHLGKNRFYYQVFDNLPKEVLFYKSLPPPAPCLHRGCSFQYEEVLTVKSKPRERKSLGSITPSSVGMELVEPEIDPADDQSAAEHGAVGPLDEPDSPHDEGESEDGQRNVPVRDLAQRRPVEDMIRHRLLDGHRHSGQVSGQTCR